MPGQVQWAKGLVKVRFPATDLDLLDQVQKLLIMDKNLFENIRPTRGWLQHFIGCSITHTHVCSIIHPVKFITNSADYSRSITHA